MVIWKVYSKKDFRNRTWFTTIQNYINENISQTRIITMWINLSSITQFMRFFPHFSSEKQVHYSKNNTEILISLYSLLRWYSVRACDVPGKTRNSFSNKLFKLTLFYLKIIESSFVCVCRFFLLIFQVKKSSVIEGIFVCMCVCVCEDQINFPNYHYFTSSSLKKLFASYKINRILAY